MVLVILKGVMNIIGCGIPRNTITTLFSSLIVATCMNEVYKDMSVAYHSLIIEGSNTQYN